MSPTVLIDDPAAGGSEPGAWAEALAWDSWRRARVGRETEGLGGLVLPAHLARPGGPTLPPIQADAGPSPTPRTLF